ncbi:MAG: plasmid pRiA4b ORF-3 family protein [Woeseiaceae bacterium]|nr:plasmid pRiA4b ORF-3 family protein [Woeseiaceae bacterium]
MSGIRTGELKQIGIPDDDPYVDEPPCLAGWSVPIAGYFAKAGDAASYEYDFGDGWRHAVVLEGIDTIREGERRLACLDGERRCPPEDCGGIYGYATMLETIADETHPEHEEILEWLGGAYDPDLFSAEDVKFDDPKVRWRNAFSAIDEGILRFSK